MRFINFKTHSNRSHEVFILLIFFLFGQARQALDNHENFIIEGAGMYRDEI